MELIKSVNNIKISINQTKSEGTGIVFLHGNSLSSEMFTKQLKSDLFQDYRFISFDFQGHGKSSKANNPIEEYSLTGILKTLTELIKELDLKKIILVGHSFGGHVAIESLKYIQNIVSGLMIFGTPPLAIPPAMQSAFLPRPEAGLVFKGDLSDDEINAIAGLFSTEKSNIQAVFKQIKKADPEFRTFIGKSLMEGQGFDEVQLLQSFGKPIAVIHGEKDPLVNLKYIEELEIPNLWRNKINIIPGAGHSPQLDNSKEFNELLKEFVDSVI